MRPRTAALLVAAFVIFSPFGLASDGSGAPPAESLGPGAGDESATVASAERLKEAGRFEEAVKLLERGLKAAVDLEVRRQLLAELGEVQFAWAEDLERQYKLKEAIKRYEQAQQIRKDVGDRAGEAATLNNIGRVHSVLGERRKALEYYEQALQIRKDVGDRAGEAVTLNHIGRAHSALGEKQKALEYYEQALPIEKAVGNRRGEAATLNNFGQVYSALGEKRKALEYYEQALPIRRAVGDRRGEAETLNNIGQVYSALGEKRKALENYGQALAIERAVGDRRGEAATLNNIGLVYAVLGEKGKALEYYEQALAIRKAVGDRAGEAETLNNIGRAHSALGESQRALEYYEQALPIERAVGDRRVEAATLNNIGMAYLVLGKKRKALEYYEQALPIRRAVGDRAGEAETLHNIGRAYSGLGEKRKALEYYEQALPIERAVGDRRGEAASLRNTMYSWEALASPRVAILFGKQSVNVYQQLRTALQGLDPDLQRTYRGTVEGTYRHLADLLIAEGRLPEAQQVLGLLKEEEFFEFVCRSPESVGTAGRADLTPEEEVWEKRYREIGDRLTAAGAEFQKLQDKKERSAKEEGRLSELDHDLEVGRLAFQKFLGELALEFGKTPSAPDRLANVQVSQTFQAALGELGTGSVALYTLVGEERYRVILVTAHAHKAAEYPIKEVDLNKKILAFREVLQNPDADPRPLARELYGILVAPIAAALAEVKAETLMWSLDGALRYLPVAALYDGEKYLVERYRNTLFTLASLNFLKDEPKGAWKVAGLGVSKAAEGFRELASVPGEMAAIVKEEGKTSGVLPGTVKLDEEFTEPAFRSSLLARYPVVHIASHFAFQPGNETNSFLLLGGGAKRRLSVAEIKGYSFAGVDLLTLSACDTATGSSADGREVDGLGMIAQKQGAKAVIATLWAVADESTGRLMAEFYRLRQAGSGMPKGEALRQAQLSLLKGAASPFSHPYFWAPFILIGNWK